jgi:hypothetical protein
LTALTESRRFVLAALGVVIAAGMVLLAMGREPICTCGYVKLWHGVVVSSENSQHVSDWYTPSHVIHGVAFYGLLWLVARRRPAVSEPAFAHSGGRRIEWPLGARLVAATLVESGWEILENTPLIINRYREATIALDYYGDSVLNSICDIGWMMLGFMVASRWPVWATLALVVIAEVGVGYAIRDNLALNILMLIYPLEAVRRWQAG